MAERSTRRRFLALAGGAVTGVAALAGCNALADDPAAPTVDGAALAGAVEGEVPQVPETLPVEIEAERNEAVAADVRATLDAVPTPLGPSEVPNEALRQELAERHDHARAALSEAAEAPSPWEATGELRGARGEAAFLEAAWAAVEGERSTADVRAVVPDAREDLTALRRRWAYAGDDPVRAVVVHRAIGDRLADAIRSLNRVLAPFRDPEGTPLGVGRLARRLAGARSSLSDAAYVLDRHAASASSAPDLSAGFETAAERLEGQLQRRRSELPDGDASDPSSLVGADAEDTAAGAALSDLYRGVDEDDVPERLAAGRLPAAVLDAQGQLVVLDAFRRLRRTVEDGEHVTVETADDVGTIRERAIRAVEETRGADPGPLVDAELHWLDGMVRFADERLGRYADDDDGVPVSAIDRELGQYVQAGLLARAIPRNADDVATVLRAGD